MVQTRQLAGDCLVLILALLALLPTRAGLPIFPGPDEDGAKISASRHDCSTGGSGGDIVVCARNDSNVMRLQAAYAEKPIRAQSRLPGGGEVRAHVEERELGGARSPAAMVTVKLPF